MFARRLAREIGALVLIKVAALILLFVLFFGPAQRPDIDARQMGEQLLREGQ